MRLLACLGFAILLSSCASSTNYYPQTVQSWHNGSMKTLVQRWGKPDETIITPTGQTLLIYRVQGFNQAERSSEPVVGVNYTRDGRPVIISKTNTNMAGTRTTLSLPCTVLFQANKNGKIMTTDTQGSGCYGNASFSAKMANPAQ